MTPSQLHTLLDHKFKVLHFVDLEELTRSPFAIHTILKEHFKEVFESNERIVFYSGYAPPRELIQNIQNAADLINVSRCFIMICCPEGLEDLFQAESEFDLEYYPIKVTSNALPKNIPTISSTMCPYPWSHLSIWHLGNVKPCCYSLDSIGNANHQSLDDLFNSPKMNQLRRQLLAGEKPAGCSKCWDLENQNLPSVRQWMLGYYSKQDFYSKWVNDPRIRSLDLRPSNVCNFKCRICDPNNSSLMLAERLAMTTNPNEITYLKQTSTLTGQWFDDSDYFIDQLIEMLPYIENIDFHGGEPFLLKQLPKLFKRATETGDAEHIRLHFSTNGSIFPVNLIPYFKKFKLVDINFSIDNVNERFEYERGGSWQEVENTIKAFQAETSVNFNFAVLATVNIQNVLYLEDLINWTNNIGHEIHLTMLEHPIQMNIDAMTDVAKDLAIKKYQNHSRKELRAISDRLKQSPRGKDGKDFVKYMQQLDSHRKQSFLKTHNEIAVAMGYK